MDFPLAPENIDPDDWRVDPAELVEYYRMRAHQLEAIENHARFEGAST